MTYNYVASFVSGLGDIVEKIIKEKISDVVILEKYDGLIIFSSKKRVFDFNLNFVNNLYLLIDKRQTDASISFMNSVKSLLNNVKLNCDYIKPNLDIKKKTFKILALDKNQPVSLDFSIIKPLEKTLEDNLKLKVAFKQHDLDFIFMRRNENVIMLLLKLSYNRITEKSLKQGELRPELAYLLNKIGNIEKNDIIIDPFCGSGAIPRQIIKHFDYNMIFASDNNEELIQKLKKEYRNNKKKFFIKQRDALNLSYFEDGFINKIITDPPWNAFNKQEEDFCEFYLKMLNEFYRILNDDGRCVILMGNVIDFEKALIKTKFKIEEKYNILVNGKKANIYKLKKSI